MSSNHRRDDEKDWGKYDWVFFLAYIIFLGLMILGMLSH